MLGNLFDMKKKKIKIPLYYGDLVMVRGKMNEIAKKYNLDCAAFEAVVWRDDKKKYLKLFVAFSEKSSPDVVAHECVHLVNHVFIHTGMKLEPYDDEAQAYLTGWFAKKINKFLKK